MQLLKEWILRVEQRAQISVKEYVQFLKKGAAQFKFSADVSGWDVGE